MKSIRTIKVFVTTLSLLISLILISVTSCVTGKAVPPSIDVGADGVLFAAGDEDGGSAEFQQRGSTGIHDYECTVGVDCVDDTFPAYLYRMSAASRWDDTGVAQVRITFNLDKAFETVFLRLVRAGAETTIVTLDNEQIHTVTSSMLKSGESSQYGSYDLSLGYLDKGIHNIELTMAEDGKANGRYGWDAIILLVK